ncbi:hypothetical protein [Frankia sp. CiP3]|uniref:hypothetical protein n=1 Tax=Frankia sp. CiP3 TaxID=2880971 RepID=UPI001EF4BC9C|nr:hypothetical protein [Frankia sp. CiP3]
MSEKQEEPGPLSLPERLAVMYHRLNELPPATSAYEALAQLNATLEAVEDEFSGVPKNPNPDLKFDGRMYPPREDFIRRAPDGGLIALTKGNRIEISPTGSITIYSRRTNEVVYSRADATPAAAPLAQDVPHRLAELQQKTTAMVGAPRGGRPRGVAFPSPPLPGEATAVASPSARPGVASAPARSPGR